MNQRLLTFTIDNEVLSFYRADMRWGTEPGAFKVFVGTNSQEVLSADFDLIK